jgi:hypothetical protein
MLNYCEVLRKWAHPSMGLPLSHTTVEACSLYAPLFCLANPSFCTGLLLQSMHSLKESHHEPYLSRCPMLGGMESSLFQEETMWFSTKFCFEPSWQGLDFWPCYLPLLRASYFPCLGFIFFVCWTGVVLLLKMGLHCRGFCLFSSSCSVNGAITIRAPSLYADWCFQPHWVLPIPCPVCWLNHLVRSSSLPST